MREFSGALIGVYADGAKVDCEVSADFTADVEMLPASAVDSARFLEYIPGNRSWSISVNGYLLLEAVGVGNTDGKALLAKLLTGDIVGIEFKTDSSLDATFSISGNCFVQNFGISASSEDATTWTVTLIGSGPFNMAFSA